MKGLVIWAYSDCRSTMALYREVCKAAGFPVVITLWHYTSCLDERDLRTKVGFRPDEFADVKVIKVGENLGLGLKVLEDYSDWNHLFCVYQGSRVYRRLITTARSRGIPVAIACEAPCNMHSGIKRFFKQFYLRFVLPVKSRSVVNASDFFISYSGDAFELAGLAGWPRSKVVPFGYFPPPIEGSRCFERKTNNPFVVLATGILSKYRGADVLVNALKILKDRGLSYRAIITQEGELLSGLKQMAERYRLPVEFPGFLPMPKLIELYETCSVYVGAGRSEPWGMRLNDALNCGAPLVVSKGMGGIKMIKDEACGLAFENGDPVDLADKLEVLAADKSLYLQCAKRACVARTHYAPASMAKEFLEILAMKGWK